MAKKRGMILFFMILLLAGITYAVSNPKPTIKVKFYEEVTILRYNLTYIEDDSNIGLRYDGVKVITQPTIHYRHNFTPISNLLEGKYNFTVEAEDLAGNRKNSSLDFTVEFEPLVIDVKEPPYGVSNKSIVNITISTNRNVACKYLVFPYSFFDGNYESESMSEFAESNGFEHTLYDYDLTKKNYLHVICREQITNKDYYKLFDKLAFDDKKPVINNIIIVPEKITEGTAPFIFNVTVNTDELATCKYGSKDNYDLMENSFLGDMTYLHNASIKVNYDGVTYKYNASCKDRVGLVSDTQEFSFMVDTSAESDIILINPVDWTSTQTVNLQIRTIKKSKCYYNNGSGEYNEFSASTDFVYEHSKTFSIPEGRHNYYVNCSYTKSRKNEQGRTIFEAAEIIKSFEIKADRTKPTNPVVNDTSDLSAYPQYSPFTNRLKVSFKAYDALSGIKEFVYKVLRGTSGIANGTADSGDCDDGWCVKTLYIEGLTLENNTQYKVKAKARDNAGMESLESTSNGVTVDTSKQLDDRIEPRGWIVKNATANAVIITLYCNDDGAYASGCNNNLMQYDTAASSTGCRLQSYIAPVTLTSDKWFCWQVGDNAGNLKSGNEFINITKETKKDKDNDGVNDIGDNCPDKYNPQQRDRDNDGLGDDCDNCPDRYNSNQDDSDGDGVGNVCDDCSDTSFGQSADANGCSKSQREKDSDRDGMPDFWERRYGLDPNDDSDADMDNDNDGFTNLQEYNDGTDPKNPNSFKTRNDADMDGVVDSRDKCPRTAAGESVDTDGCSSTQKLLDKDGDGMPDSWETANSLDPDDPNDANSDKDGDGLINLDEYSYGTNPGLKDSDDDKYSDKKEIDKGTDPLDPNSYPSSNFFSVLLLVLGILILLGGAGFLAYTQIQKRGFEFKPQMPRPVQRPPIRPTAIRPAQRPVLRPKAVQEKIEQRRAEKKEERKKLIEEAIKPKKPDVFSKLSKITAEEEKKETFKKLSELSKKKK